MASLTAYRGLQVLSPDPTGDGGLAIQNDLKALVDWSPKSVWAQSADPTVDDDETEDFFPGSIWLRTNTTPPKLFVCRSSATGAAVWQQILLEVAQDSTYAHAWRGSGRQWQADRLFFKRGHRGEAEWQWKGRIGNHISKYVAASGGTNCHSDNDENGELFDIVDR